MNDVSPVACVSIIAPDGSPLYMQKYSISSLDTNLEIESLIFESLQIAKTQKTFENLPVPPQSHVVPLAKGQNFQTFGSQTPLKYKVLITTAKTAIIELTLRRAVSVIVDELFARIADPFYSPFSAIKNELFDIKISEAISVIKAAA